MSLRQLKFKPKLQPSLSKVNKATEVSDSGDTNVKLSESPADPNILTSNRKDNLVKNDTSDHSEIPEKNNVEPALGAIKSCTKVIPLLPSLRQLKCKPKINSFTSRSTSKIKDSRVVPYDTEIHSSTNGINIPSLEVANAMSPQGDNEDSDKNFENGKGPSENKRGSGEEKTNIVTEIRKEEILGASDSSTLGNSDDQDNTLEINKELSEKQMVNQDDEKDSNIEKKPCIGKHILPIRQLNFKPKINIGDRISRPWKAKVSSTNVGNANKCNDLDSSSDQLAGNLFLPEISETYQEPIASVDVPNTKDYSISTKFNDSQNQRKISSRKLVGSRKKSPTSLCFNSTKENEFSPKEIEINQILENKKVQNMNVILEEKIDNPRLNCDPIKEIFKNKLKSSAVHGSKSIRSCHLSVPFKPKLTNRPKRAFASSTFGKMSFEAKQQFEKKFGDKKPDSSQLTMLDSIFYNPTSDPMPKEEWSCEKQSSSESKQKEKDSDVCNDSTDGANSGSDNSNGDVPVPQLKLSADGKVVIAQESLVIEQTLGPISDDVKFINGERFKKKKPKELLGRGAGWSHDETLKFYKALNTIGSDFELMQSIFPNRSRANLKYKFKKEERIRGKLIDKVMTAPSEFNLQKVVKEIELDETYEMAVSYLGRNLQKRKMVPKRNRLLHVDRKKKPEDLTSKEFKKIAQHKIEPKPKKERCLSEFCPMAKRKRACKETENIACDVKSDKPNNIVISANIEYENLKYTQCITYNSNNLDNPIEVNTTISHDSEQHMSFADQEDCTSGSLKSI